MSKTETVKFEVSVKINYDDPIDKKFALKLAKSCLLGSSIFGATGATPTKVKLIK